MNAKMKNRKRNQKILLIVVGVILAVLFIRHMVIRAVQLGSKTVIPEILVFEDDYPLSSVIVMREDVAKAGGEGVLTTNVAEGTKIPAGTEIASINLMTDKSGSREQLLKVQSAIDYKTQSMQPTDNSEYSVTTSERSLVENIQKAIADENYYEVIMNMTNLDLTTRRSVDISELGNLLEMEIGELENLKNTLISDINTSSLRYYSQHGGLVSFIVDGYESQLVANNFEDYSYEYINNLKADAINKREQQVHNGDAIYKLIDNFEWYLAILVEDPQKWEQYEVGSRLSFKVDGTLVSGKISMLQLDETKGVAIIKFDEKLEQVYQNRFPEVFLVKQKVRAYKFPASATITNEDGQMGVYVKEINGIVKFRPIELLQETEEFVYANIGDESGYILDAAGEKIKTITMYDEIMINPGVVKEGQVLD